MTRPVQSGSASTMRQSLVLAGQVGNTLMSAGVFLLVGFLAGYTIPKVDSTFSMGNWLFVVSIRVAAIAYAITAYLLYIRWGPSLLMLAIVTGISGFCFTAAAGLMAADGGMNIVTIIIGFVGVWSLYRGAMLFQMRSNLAGRGAYDSAAAIEEPPAAPSQSVAQELLSRKHQETDKLARPSSTTAEPAPVPLPPGQSALASFARKDDQQDSQ